MLYLMRILAAGLMLCCRFGDAPEAPMRRTIPSALPLSALPGDGDSLGLEEIPMLSRYRLRAFRAEFSSSVPRPPRRTRHRAWWTVMLLKWFFELGENPAFYDSDSPQSLDIADSFSMSMIVDEYLLTGAIPEGWIFRGPDTALGAYGEVEWFIGSYSIIGFHRANGTAEFLVYNKSGWRSGTRLPVTWQYAVRRKTSRTVTEFIDDAPRGSVLKYKILYAFPGLARIPAAVFLLDMLPSFGGDWEQFYLIRMPWPEREGGENPEAAEDFPCR